MIISHTKGQIRAGHWSRMDPVCEFCLREQSQIAKSNSTNREQGRSEPSRSEKLMTQISFSLVPAISDLTLEQSACDTDQEGKKKR